MEAVGQLTGGLAHDFNNLLTGISGSIEVLQTRISQGRVNETDRYITAAQGAVRRAAALIHRLLAFSRRQTLDPKPVNVNRLVANLEDLIRRTVGPATVVEVIGGGGLWTTLSIRTSLKMRSSISASTGAMRCLTAEVSRSRRQTSGLTSVRRASVISTQASM